MLLGLEWYTVVRRPAAAVHIYPSILRSCWVGKCESCFFLVVSGV